MATSLQVKLLTREEESILQEKCLHFLSKVGVKIDHPEALKMISSAGAQVDFQTNMVKFPVNLIEAALRTVPRPMKLAGNDKKRDLSVPDATRSFFLRTGTGARSYVSPLDNSFRDITLADCVEWGQMLESLDEVDIPTCLTPMDMPAATADVHSVKVMFENTTKHLGVQPFSGETCGYIFEMAQVMAGSREELKKRPIVSVITGSCPPYSFGFDVTDLTVRSCKLGIPIGAYSLPAVGASSPVTMAGSVLTSSIEILTQVIISQLMSPGVGVYAGPIHFVLDMASGRNLQSSLVAIMGSTATCQFCRDIFDLPTATYGYGTDSHTTDGQALIETTQIGMMTSLGGVDILCGAGQLEVATAISPVQLIIDCMQTKMFKRIVSGVPVNEETIAWSDVVKTPPLGHFLENPHTLKHCREAFRSDLFTYEPREVWEAEGSKDLHARAVEKYHELKKTMKPRRLPDDVQKELDNIVKAADKHLAQ